MLQKLKAFSQTKIPVDGKWVLGITFVGDKYNNYGSDTIANKDQVFFFVGGNSVDAGMNPSGGSQPSGESQPSTVDQSGTENQTTTPATPSSQQPTVEQEPITISKTPASLKAKAKKNKVTVSWKKIKKTKKTKKLLAQFKSIQVQYSTDPQFEQNSVTKKVGKKKTKIVLKLQKKTTYYVRVRYVGKDGVSRWSGVKRIKTK